MDFNELKTRFIDTVQSRWSDFQESSLYIQLRDRYEELSPRGQKLSRWGSCAFLALALLVLPLSWIQSSSEQVTDFEEKKELIRDLLRLRRDLANSPNIPPPISSAELKSQVDGALGQMGLGGDQKKESMAMSFQPEVGSKLIPNYIVQNGVQVTLTQLNLKQVVDIAFKLQTLSEMIKVTAMDLKARAENPHYYDVMFRVVNFDLKHEGDGENSFSKAVGKKKP